MALLAAGVAAYYAAPVGLRLLRPKPQPALTPIAVVKPATGPVDQAGDVVLLNCLAAIERRRTIEAEIVQAGYVLNQPVEAAGVYRQKGRAVDRRFATLLQGRVANTPLRLWQVSNGVHLYTDMLWGEGDDASRRNVTQIDLREVRREVTQDSRREWSRVGAGQAAATSLNPALSAAFGGLPMLVESLSANFHFGAARKMELHNQPVFAMIGHWRPASLAALTEPGGDAPSKATSARLPHHVLLVLGASDLFPYLIEYRAPADPLSADQATDDARLLQQSGRPLLRLEFRRPLFDQPIADAQFQYPEAGTVGRADITASRLETLRKRRQLKLATRAGVGAQ